MCEVLIFGGTSEGRELAEYCAESEIMACVSVTTDYGSSLLPESEYIKKITGKLDLNQIKEIITQKGFTIVIDATHPYAVQATENIKNACNETFTEYIRVIRKSTGLAGTVFDTLDNAVKYFNSNRKLILSTVGSKELSELVKINGFEKRVFARVLPSESIIEYCHGLGLDDKHIIAEKGAFSVNQNVEHIKITGAEILFTKESGKEGGYPEKATACELCGIELVTLKRPAETGIDIESVKKILLEREGFY